MDWRQPPLPPLPESTTGSGHRRRQVTLHTDGSCSGNPGPGGWAAVLDCGPVRKELAGGDLATTSNRMELTAILRGLQALTRPCQVLLVTDSRNALGWLCGGWQRRSPDIRALCAAIDQQIAAGEHVIIGRHVNGHAGQPGNERANQLAQAETRKLLECLRHGHRAPFAGPPSAEPRLLSDLSAEVLADFTAAFQARQAAARQSDQSAPSVALDRTLDDG